MWLDVCIGYTIGVLNTGTGSFCRILYCYGRIKCRSSSSMIAVSNLKLCKVIMILSYLITITNVLSNIPNDITSETRTTPPILVCTGIQGLK